MTESVLEHIDILIIGAGPVGMTLQLALATGGQKSNIENKGEETTRRKRIVS